MLAENYDFTSLVTPINIDVFESLMHESKYDKAEIEFIVEGFKNGFSIGYQGPQNRRSFSRNHKLKVGTEIDLWNKVINEVKEGRYIGPLTEQEIPWNHLIQSPLSLVKKKNSDDKKLRLVFDLSYPKGDSVNSHTPEELKRTSYFDIDHAISNSLQAGKGCYYTSSDFSAAFRRVPLRKQDWKWLMMRAKCPLDGKDYFFADKNLCFGSGVSCAIFQRISNAVAHVFQHITKGLRPTNFLDDFLQVEKNLCLSWKNLKEYEDLCKRIQFPLADEKTTQPTQIIIFLGMLLNSLTQTVSIPVEKRNKALTQIENLLRCKKTTVKYLQQITGLLNFICRAVVPGRAFTRRLYAKVNTGMKPYYHIRMDREMKNDLMVWKNFLADEAVLCRPFIDFTGKLSKTAIDQDFNSDASAAIDKGFGCFYKGKWFAYKWQDCGAEFLKSMQDFQISINYLELVALTMGVISFAESFRNKRVNIFCDNQSVVQMINQSTSSCRRCMILIRIITLISLKFNCRIFAKWLKSEDNVLSDALSRGDFCRFWNNAPLYTSKVMKPLPKYIWPLPHSWIWDKKLLINMEFISRLQEKEDS